MSDTKTSDIEPSKGTGHQQCACAMAGFGVQITSQFHYIHLSRATSRNWSGLTFRFAAFLSPPIPATAQAPTLAARLKNNGDQRSKA